MHFPKRFQSPYLRYVDDRVVLGDDVGWLGELRERIKQQLAAERLCLHPAKAEISRTSKGLDFLGYRVFPDFRLLRNDNGHRFARTHKRLALLYRSERIGWRDVEAYGHSWLGHAWHADGLYSSLPTRQLWMVARLSRRVGVWDQYAWRLLQGILRGEF
jgi:hypothetical protein